MKPQLNHTIIRARDKQESATFLAETMGFDPPIEWGHLLAVETGNGGGRGVYFLDPSGHFLEILTRPYGSGPRS